MVDGGWWMVERRSRRARPGPSVADQRWNERKNMFVFERLDTWRKAIDFADLVYQTTSSFPGEERFGLTSQMRRAADSVSSNIAEGSSRFSKADFARFLELATGSVFEVVSQSFLARQQGFLNDADFQKLYAAAEEQGRMLSGLRNSQLKAR